MPSGRTSIRCGSSTTLRTPWLLSRLVVIRYEFNTAEYVTRVNYPVLVLHSPEDDIMPFSLGEKVFEAANEPKQFVRMRGDHNSGFYLSQPEYEQVLGQWVTNHVQ